MSSLGAQFICFCAVTLALFHFGRFSLRWRHSVLLLGSLFFLARQGTGVVAFLPFAAFLVLSYGLLLVVRRYPAHAGASIVVILMLFAWLKRYAFYPKASFLPFVYVTAGISYCLFRIIHLVVEEGAGAVENRPGPLRFLLYVLYFPVLLSGPIQSWRDFDRQQSRREPPRMGLCVVAASIERLIRGYFKIEVAAAALAAFHGAALSRFFHGGGDRVVSGALAFAVYPFFLYCNFSGYIDAVIAVSRLFGIELPENFNRPFSSDSFIGFWTRWHITLSQWLKTYVYNPLLMALMRRWPSRGLEQAWGILAFFVTFFLVGIWHGQTGAFLVFGVLQGGGVAGNKLWQLLMTSWLGGKRYRAIAAKPLYCLFARGATFSWFTFTMIWFWTGDAQLARLWHAVDFATMASIFLLIFLASSLALGAYEQLRTWVRSFTIQSVPFVDSRYWRVVCTTWLLLLAAAVSVLSHQSAPDIVYKAF